VSETAKVKPPLH